MPDKPRDCKTPEQFAREFKVTMAELLTWESQKDFQEAVRDTSAPWIYRKQLVMQALLTRASSTTDKEQLRYAAAYLLAIGDDAGNELAKLLA